MPLTAEQQAELKGVFDLVRGRFTLAASVKTALLGEMVSRERPVAELPPFPAPGDDSEEIVEEWTDLATDAGLTKLSDVNGVKRWVLAKEAPARNLPDARAAAVVDVLVERGIAVPAKVAAEVAATLRQQGDQGDIQAQATSAVAIAIVYTGELPGVEMVEWIEARSRALRGSTGTVDLRSCPSYRDLHKHTTRTTLERALLDRDESNRKLRTHRESVTQALYGAGLPLAATRWQMVLGWAADHYRWAPKNEKTYLWGYFFNTFLGLGMPDVKDRDTLLDMQAPVPGGGLNSIENEMRPTHPKDAVGSPTSVIGGSASLGSGLPVELGTLLLQQQQQLDLLSSRVAGMGPSAGGESNDDPPIKELPAPGWPKCHFCQQAHDPSVKCQALKLALRLKADHDKAQAKARKEAEAQATPPAAAPPAAAPPAKP